MRAMPERKRFLRGGFFSIYLLLLLVPTYAVLANTGNLIHIFSPTLDSIAFTYLFLRLTGLYGITFLFVQIMLGGFLPVWQKIFGGRAFVFHEQQGILAYSFILFHPSLFLINSALISGERSPLYFLYLLLPNYSNLREYYITFGKLGLTLLTLGVFAAYFRHKDYLNRHWRKFHILNYLAFFAVWYHSWKIGTDTHAFPMSWLYPLFLGGVLLTLLYRFVWPQIGRAVMRKMQILTKAAEG